MTKEEFEAVEQRHMADCIIADAMNDGWFLTHADRSALIGEVRRLRRTLEETQTYADEAEAARVATAATFEELAAHLAAARAECDRLKEALATAWARSMMAMAKATAPSARKATDG